MEYRVDPFSLMAIDSSSSSSSQFPQFSRLPPEVRSYIWKASLTPRIIKWARLLNEDGITTNIFTAPSKPLTVFYVSRESRQVATLYCGYRNISTTSKPVYFSPERDYLFLDIGWTDLVPRPRGIFAPPPPPIIDPLDSILPQMVDVKQIMVHPNYDEERKKPRAKLERFPHLQEILIAASEKSIGVQSSSMQSSIYDLKKYYEAIVRPQNLGVKIPHIAVGCLGWPKDERRSIYPGQRRDEDSRELIAVFEEESEMKAHLRSIREEEWSFTQRLKMQQPKKSILKFRPGKEIDLGSYTPSRPDSLGREAPTRISPPPLPPGFYQPAQAATRPASPPPTYSDDRTGSIVTDSTNVE